MKVEKVVLYPTTSQRTQSDYEGREGGPPSHHFPEDPEWIWRQRKWSSTPSPPRGPSSPKEQLVSSREGLEKQAGILRSGRLCPSTAFFSTLVFPWHLVCGWACSGAELVLTRAGKGVAATPHHNSCPQWCSAEQSGGLGVNLVPKRPVKFGTSFLQCDSQLSLLQNSLKGFKNCSHLDFPSDLVVKTLCFQEKGPRFSPWLGNRSHMTQLRVCTLQI